MQQRLKRPALSARSRWLAPLAFVAALALVVAWWRPWQALVTSPRPAPVRPTPTATGVPERIALPTALPRANATPAAAGASTPTPAGADRAEAGSLLYLGAVEGRSGIVAINADGSDRRLLAPGTYDALTWSPDGSRFAALGPIAGGPAYQVAVFAPDGRALARYPFDRQVRCPPPWSPDGNFLLCYALPADSEPEGLRFDTWVIDTGKSSPAGGVWPAAAPPGANVFPYGWTPDNRIAFIASDGPGLARPSTLWTTDLEGHSPLKLYQGIAYPIGWSPTGAVLYALDYASPGDRLAGLTRLIAINLPQGTIRPVIGADELAVAALGVPLTPGAYLFDFASLSPDGARLAVGLIRGGGGGKPTSRAEAGTGALVLVQPGGLIDGVVPITAAGLGSESWSPDSSRLALFSSDPSGDTQLRIFDATAAILATYPLGNTYPIDLLAVWSPDGRWLTYGTVRGPVIAAAGGTPRSYPLAPDGYSPVWRPVRRP